MKKYYVSIGLVIVIACVTLTVVKLFHGPNYVLTGENATSETEGLNLDANSAVQIAEIVLVKVYGKDVLRERPWNVKTEGNTFEIEGTFPYGRNEKGGVAIIRIDRTNAKVVSVIHEK